ncbi:MAG TPA: hypothetical protein PLP66_07100 [Phycisphaerae bacterium]|nr:hypothetical protein [Phycisphaerae bacterium]HQL53302.1 hypothetical protein [Phycisphaerae bacterium]
MFLRRYERKKNGKGHVYWALVESIRTARGSRQKVVAYLGDVKKGTRTGWAALGRRLTRRTGRPRRCSIRRRIPNRPRSWRWCGSRACAWNGSATSATSGWRWGGGDS